MRRGWLVRVADEQGRWGTGEAAPLAGFGMESHRAAGAALARWAKALPGSNLKAGPSADEPPPPWFGLELGEPGTPAARHGLELALLDLAAQRAGLPLARFLHPAAIGPVLLNATVGANDPAETAGQATALVAQGFRTLKLKVGADDPRADLRRLRVVREAVGPRVRLRLDANGAWSESVALRLLEKLAPLDIEYVEQPLPARSLGAMARLVERSPIPLAADEAASSAAGARRVLERGAAHLLVLKPMALGGLLTTLEVARAAARQGVPVVLTTTLEGAFARLGAVHAAAALEALQPPHLPRYAHGLATGSLLARDLVAEPPEPRGGKFILPEAPGLGIASPDCES